MINIKYSSSFLKQILVNEPTNFLTQLHLILTTIKFGIVGYSQKLFLPNPTYIQIVSLIYLLLIIGRGIIVVLAVLWVFKTTQGQLTLFIYKAEG